MRKEEITKLLTTFLHHYADNQKKYKDWKTEDVAKVFTEIWLKKRKSRFVASSQSPAS